MINIPGVSYALPGAYAEGEIISSGLSIPANQRVLCIMGEGARREMLVNFAAGNGQDGWDSTYTTSTSGTDGRHFLLSQYPIISNRTVLYKNGIPLTGIEDAIDSSPFSYLYDYRLDINLGRIELQTAHLVDQGGAYYLKVGSNVGNGTINSLTLLDDNAPTETWTVRCSTVRYTSGGVVVDGYAQFVATGSVSGVVLDGYGAPVLWQSDGTIRNNGILKFGVSEGLVSFNKGDTFTIKVESGVLSAGDNLLAEYIGTLDVNDPELFTDMDSVVAKHGLASITHPLSLGCQLAFANGTPGILCCQTAPSVPRRLWTTVASAPPASWTVDDNKFILPLGSEPDTSSDVKFVIFDTVTLAETQIFPNKVAFYDSTITANPNVFIASGIRNYSYTVVLKSLVKNEGTDLVIVPIGGGLTATVTSASVSFDLSDVTATTSFQIYDATVAANNGTWTINSVSNGALVISRLIGAFVAATATKFRELDSSETSAYVLLTKDIQLTTAPVSQGLKVGIVDIKDSTFYDASWITALEKLESFELDILVPLPLQTKSAIIQSALQHCLAMSRIKNRKERILFTGAIQGLLPNNVTGVSLAAVEDIGVLEGIQGDDPLEILGGLTEDLTNYSVSDAFGGTYRCVYHYPDRIVVSISGSNTYVDGMFMAAAHGGLLSGTGSVEIPSTNKTLAGFSILRDRMYSTTVAENITKAGITLVEPVLGGGRIVWGKTTSQSGYPEEEEISICFIRDKVAKMSRLAVQGLIGQPESPSFAISLQVRINSLCLSFISQRLITKFADIIVVRDLVDPRQWNCRFRIQPTYPINWIYIKFSLGAF